MAALGLIDVRYEALPVVADPVSARQPGAALVHDNRPDGNLLKHIKVRKGEVDDGFREADVVIEKTYRTPMTEHLFLEPECAVGAAGYDPAVFGGAVDPGPSGAQAFVADKVTVCVGSQDPLSRPIPDRGRPGP